MRFLSGPLVCFVIVSTGLSEFPLAPRVLLYAGEETAEGTTERAPLQSGRQHKFLAPANPVVTLVPVDDVFDVWAPSEPVESKLPPIASSPLANPLSNSRHALVDDDGFGPSGIRRVQYPLDASAADELDPFEDLSTEETLPGAWSPHHQGAQPVEDRPRRGLKSTDHRFVFTYVPAGGSDLSLTTLDFRTSIFPEAFPLLRVSPQFGWHFIDDDVPGGLPDQLYDFSLSSLLILPLSNEWMVHLAVGPSLRTDGHNLSSEAWRVIGRVLAFYRWSESLRLVGGLVYLDRDDLPMLPAVGLVYTPEPDIKLDLMFPRPKYSRRYYGDSDRERWWYVAGELGGGTWAIERSSGFSDVANIKDYRLIVGIEHREIDVFSWHVEGGYVFGRRIEYDRGGDRDVGDTGFLRVGVSR